ncbi:trichohyalin, partial [Reticulomyxa filosa]
MGGCCTAPPVEEADVGSDLPPDGLSKDAEPAKETSEERRQREKQEEQTREELARKREQEELERKMEEERQRKLEEERQRKLEEERQRRLKWAQKRVHSIEELINTEQTYVDSLSLCIDLFANPLENMPKAISRNDHRVLFSDIKTIRGINEAFLQELLQDWKSFDNDKTMIGEHFIKFTPYFRQYQNYLNNYGNSIDLLFRIVHSSSSYEVMSPLSPSLIPLPFTSNANQNLDGIYILC